MVFPPTRNQLSDKPVELPRHLIAAGELGASRDQDFSSGDALRHLIQNEQRHLALLTHAGNKRIGLGFQRGQIGQPGIEGRISLL
jgi:hypothetical protein